MTFYCGEYANRSFKAMVFYRSPLFLALVYIILFDFASFFLVTWPSFLDEDEIDAPKPILCEVRSGII